MRGIAGLSGVALVSLALWAQNAPTDTKSKDPAKAKAKKRRKPLKRPPKVSAAVRTAAIQQVNESVDGSETFDNGAALVPFFERLFRMKDGTPAVHVLHYGDSHTASDDFANAVRALFQERFGSGGPGFAMPGQPYQGYRRYDLRSGNSRNWRTEGTPLRPGDGMHGLGGVSLTARRPGETMTLTAAGDDIQLLFLQQPGGGRFDIYMDGVREGVVSTDGALGPASLPLPTTPLGSHSYLIRTRSSAPVRMLGTIVENRTGVTWETLGINGAQASIMNDWDPRLLATHMAKRDAAMIMLAYGTNEANSPRWNPAAYTESLRGVIGRIRELAPAATILLVGPPDCRVKSPSALTEVVEIQRQTALELNCAFWNWRARMGGEGAIRTWVNAGMGQWDYIHMTTAGYQLVGRTLYRDLMGQYDRFLKVRTATENAQAR